MVSVDVKHHVYLLTFMCVNLIARIYNKPDYNDDDDDDDDDDAQSAVSYTSGGKAKK